MLTQIQDFLKLCIYVYARKILIKYIWIKNYIAFNYFLHSKHNNIQYLIKQTDIQNSFH